jgi:hypothetical protein
MNEKGQIADVARNHIAAIFDDHRIINSGDIYAEKIRKIPLEVLLSPPPSKIEPKIKTTLSWADVVDHIAKALREVADEDDVIQAYESMFPGSDLSYNGDSMFTLECCIDDN